MIQVFLLVTKIAIVEVSNRKKKSQVRFVDGGGKKRIERTPTMFDLIL